MLKKSIFALMILPSLFSCKSKIGVIQQQSQKEPKSEQTELKNQTEEKIITGTVLKENSALYIFGRDKKMHSFTSLSESTGADGLFIEDKIDKILLEEKNITEEYFHIIYDNVDFWIYGENYAANSKPALILENCPLYSDDAMTVPYSPVSILPFGTPVAVQLKDENRTDSKAIEIYFYDKSSAKKITAYADEKNISTLTDDIEVMKIVKKLKVTQRAHPRNELFHKAEKYKPCKKVAAALKAQQTEYITNNYEDALKALPKTRYGVNVGELMTVDQSKDPFK